MIQKLAADRGMIHTRNCCKNNHVRLLSALLVCFVFSGTLFSQTLVKVTDCNLNGWVKDQRGNAKLWFNNGPSTLITGKGSCHFETPDQSFARIRNSQYSGTPLLALTEFSYSTFIEQRDSTVDVNFVVILVDINGDNSTEFNLVYDPRYQTAPFIKNGMPEQGKTQIGIWQTWDALRGGWFVGPEPIDDPDHGGAFFTLAEFAATHPGARIMNDVAKGGAAIRLSVGGPVFSPNFIGDADNFKIGVNGATITYDFELTIADAGPDKNVIYGYGSNCINLNGTADGGVAPYSYSWIPAGPSSGNDQLTICPTQNTMYTLTVTDSKGCVGTDDAMVTVKDVRCGTKLEKVAVCHRGEEICVAASSVAAHLNHGDALGACATSAIVRKAESAVKMDAVEVYKLSNYPNPFSGATKISYRVPYDAHVSVKVYDVAGNEIATLVNRYQKAGSYSTDFLPGKIKQGFYYYRLTTTSSKQNFSVAGKMMMVD